MRTSILLATLLITSFIYGQDNPKRIIGFAPLINNSNLTEQEAQNVYEHVLNPFKFSKRFGLVDLEEIKNNKEEQEQGITHILECELEGIKIKEVIKYAYTDSTERRINTNVEVSATLGFRVRIYNLTTGELEIMRRVVPKAMVKTRSHRTKDINMTRLALHDDIKEARIEAKAMVKPLVQPTWEKVFKNLYIKNYDFEIVEANEKKIKRVKVIGGEHLKIEPGEFINVFYETDIDFGNFTQTFHRKTYITLKVLKPVKDGYLTSVFGRGKELKKLYDSGVKLKCYYQRKASKGMDYPTLGVLPIITEENMSNDELKWLHSALRDGLKGSIRYKILDRSKFDLLNKTIETQKQSIFENASLLAEQGKKLGAEYILVSRLSKFDPYEVTAKDIRMETLAEKKGEAIGKLLEAVGVSDKSPKTANIDIIPYPNFKSNLILNIKIIETETGKIMHSDEWKKNYAITTDQLLSRSKMLYKDSMELFRTLSLLNASGIVNKKNLRSFPNFKKNNLSDAILKIEASKKGKAQEVWVASYQDLSEWFVDINVYQRAYEEVDGEKLRLDKKIGELKKPIESDAGYHRCKVKKGAKAIFELMEKGEDLYIKVE